MKVPTGSTGKPLRVIYEPDTIKFRGEDFDCMYISFRDDELDEGYTTTESDSVWWNQVTNQYREKHGIPYQDEIIALRERYGVSAAKMSVILGFGANQYRLYEDGEVPSESNGKMIRSAMNPRVFLDLIESSRHQMSEKDYLKISARVKDVIIQSEKERGELISRERLYRCERGLANGFAPQSALRLKNLFLYVLNRMGETFQTKMNKVLFYIDFLSYRERGMAISGLTYQAIDFGPVPQRWDRVYSAFDEVEVCLRLVQEQECLVLRTDTEADTRVFSESELAIMDEVCSRLKDLSSREVSKLSHGETAWKNHVGKAGTIPFPDAFSISGM